MKYADDEALDRLLGVYEVAPADDALLERIMAQAGAQQEQRWRKALPAMAACALLGFVAGGASYHIPSALVASAQATGSDDNLEMMILDPTTIQEVML